MNVNATRQIFGSRFDAVSGDGGRALEELRLQPGATVLDVGTGNGNFAIYLAAQGYQVVTGEPDTDHSRYAGRDWAPRAEAAGVLDRIRFEAFDASQLPFPAETFDAVFFFGVLHHVAEHLRGEAFREALRVVKRDGAVVFLEPGEEMLRRVRMDDPSHPPAANPSDYRPGRGVVERRLEGALMNTFIYRTP